VHIKSLHIIIIIGSVVLHIPPSADVSARYSPVKYGTVRYHADIPVCVWTGTVYHALSE